MPTVVSGSLVGVARAPVPQLEPARAVSAPLVWQTMTAGASARVNRLLMNRLDVVQTKDRAAVAARSVAGGVLHGGVCGEARVVLGAQSRVSVAVIALVPDLGVGAVLPLGVDDLRSVRLVVALDARHRAVGREVALRKHDVMLRSKRQGVAVRTREAARGAVEGRMPRIVVVIGLVGR